MNWKDALELSRSIFENVHKNISKLVGKEEGSRRVDPKRETKVIDKVAEDTALDILKSYDVTVVTEESGVVGNGEIYVALDPIDGTYNATKNIPIYSISICFSRSKFIKDIFFGYVANLATCTEYWANSSCAFRNDEKIKVSNKHNLEDCNAIVYFPVPNLLKLSRLKFKRIRTFGSAALEICFIADASFDCFIDIRDKNGLGILRVFDIAAGVFIAKKAGAIVTDEKGKSIDNKEIKIGEKFKLIIANKRLHSKIVEMLKA